MFGETGRRVRGGRHLLFRPLTFLSGRPSKLTVQPRYPRRGTTATNRLSPKGGTLAPRTRCCQATARGCDSAVDNVRRFRARNRVNKKPIVAARTCGEEASSLDDVSEYAGAESIVDMMG